MNRIQDELEKYKYFSYAISGLFLLHIVSLANAITLIQNLAVFMVFFSFQIFALDRMIKADKEMDTEGII
jgi:hypothetical protein